MDEIKNTNISVILPLHEINDNLKNYFTVAVNSVKKQEVLPDELLIVIKPEDNLKEFVNNFDYTGINYRVVENTTGNYDFPSQMNFAVKNELKTDWFSFLEVDDEYSIKWFKNVVKYKEVYPEVDMFLPIIYEVDVNGSFKGTTNEGVWVHDFGFEPGVLENQSLLQFEHFSFDGMVMKKDKYIEIGGIKSKIKLLFIYEFLLRATYKSCRVMTIPKCGYKHVNQRPDSLLNTTIIGMTQEEVNFWINTAKKEYFHTNDRDISNFIITK